MPTLPVVDFVPADVAFFVPWDTRLTRGQLRQRNGQCRQRDAHIFGTKLSPVNFWCDISELVSCYALFKGWLPLSQPPNCQRNLTAFFTLSLV